MNPEEADSRFDRLRLPDGERDAIRLEHLDQSLRDAYLIVDELEERARTKRRNVELLKELHARQRELIAELQLTERVRLTEERQTREAVRAFEVEKAKVERARTRVDWPRRGRPVRIDVDDDAWAVLRVNAPDNNLTIIRYLGEIAEEEAHHLGWRAE
jgi:hypothetical protein